MSRFASNPAFQPTEVRRFIKHLDSGAGTLVVETDAGPAYLKAMGNRAGYHVLACELVGTRLAAATGLRTFDHALVDITEIDELPFFRGGHAAPGPGFVTRMESGSTGGNNQKLLKQVNNPADISRLVCMDTWVRNPDRHGPDGHRKNYDNVFFSTETGDDRVKLIAMDFTHAFTNGGDLTRRVRDIGNVKDEKVFGLFPEFRKRLDRGAVRSFCERLDEFPSELARETVELIPREWEVEPDARNALIGFICDRAKYLADVIEGKLFDPPQALFLGERGDDA